MKIMSQKVLLIKDNSKRMYYKDDLIKVNKRMYYEDDLTKGSLYEGSHCRDTNTD